MKEFIIIVIFILFMIGILNFIEIKKIRKLEKEKQVIFNFIDEYMKLYWNFLPPFIKDLKKSKTCDKNLLSSLMMERNHIYERMDISEKLISHAKIEEILKKIYEMTAQEENIIKKAFRLKEIEAQIINMSKEYERICTEIKEKKNNPFLKILFLFIKI